MLDSHVLNGVVRLEIDADKSIWKIICPGEVLYKGKNITKQLHHDL